MSKGNSGRGGYDVKSFVKAPKDHLSKDEILSANRLGLKHGKEGDFTSFRTPTLQKAYELGHKGKDLSSKKVVKGIRFGKAPESGLSWNFSNDRSERGLSLAQEKGKKMIGSSMWFADRKAYEYKGLKIGKGSDGETMILSFHVKNLDK